MCVACILYGNGCRRIACLSTPGILFYCETYTLLATRSEQNYVSHCSPTRPVVNIPLLINN